MAILNNLPQKPYKKFFGRQKTIEHIKTVLLDGNTFIASIDGVGGIGKTALAYYFCDEVLLNDDCPESNRFDYIIWITAKDTVFDVNTEKNMIKHVKNDFLGVETLINTVIDTTNFDDELRNKTFKDKKKFVEDEILKKEPIFFVLDNLENIHDPVFFEYITKEFNLFAANNRNLKVLTTSRRRKKIADFPIEIEGLCADDALNMLLFHAHENKINDIINATEHNNRILVTKVGNIPLGVEFIIGQMKLGKSRGKIYEELNGYPSLEDNINEAEKKKRMSEIIAFSFKDMQNRGQTTVFRAMLQPDPH